eukprot:1784464-Rhodomonas_salina.1
MARGSITDSRVSRSDVPWMVVPEAIERVKTFAGNNPAAILRIRSAWLCTDQCYTATVPYMEFWVISVVKDALVLFCLPPNAFGMQCPVLMLDAR